jgi:hypothetical protein
MPSRSAARPTPHPVPVKPAKHKQTAPRWLRPLILALGATLLIGAFSPEIWDSDFWWHLRTGQYIWQQHSLPLPDPFSFTSSLGKPAYPGEGLTRHFNLTHEWLAEAIFYLIYAISGFPGIVLFRAAMLTVLCGIAGLLAYHRCRSFYRALAAVTLTAIFVDAFALDRPYQFTFLFLAITIAILERRRPLWLLPPIFLIWANCHSGYFLGWGVLAAYSLEALVLRLRDHRLADDGKLWTVSAVSLLVSGLNPNGFRVFEVMLNYRRSFLTSTLLEWAPTPLWPPSLFTLMLVGALAALVWARKRVRLADWLLFGAFAAGAIMARRNEVLLAFWAPILMAGYLPAWKRSLPAAAEFAVAALVACGIVVGVARGDFFQFRAAEWRYPSGAAAFLAAHKVSGPMFNTYEYGGYLIWRLWPLERVFVDGRALNESVFMDYTRILYNHDESGGKSAQELLEQYGIQVIVMNGFEYTSGALYLLAPSLGDPRQTEWKLVYQDPQAVVFMRNPPAGVQPLDSLAVFDHLEAECGLQIDHQPEFPRCARSLGQAFSTIGMYDRARRWLGIYLDHHKGPDPQAQQAYGKLLNMSH